MYQPNRWGLIALAGALMLSGCNDGNDKAQNNAKQAPAFVSQAPDAGFYDFPKPEPKKEPAPVEEAPKPEPTPAPAPKPETKKEPAPAPPPPPIQPTDAQLDAFRNRVMAERMLKKRRQAGPRFMNASFTHGDAKQPTKWKMSDEDLHDTGAPYDTTTLPVDLGRTLTEKAVIRTILLNPILTSLPGNPQFMVSRDVYFSDRKAKALHKGDLLFGRYKQLQQGEDRVNICFYRIERFDGVTLYDSNDCFAVATDQMGRVGLIAQIDNRLYERYRDAGLMAALSLAPAVAAGVADVDNDTVKAGAAQFSQNMGQAMTQALQQNSDLAPIGTVAGGSVAFVRLLKDIDFKKVTAIKTANNTSKEHDK